MAGSALITQNNQGLGEAFMPHPDEVGMAMATGKYKEEYDLDEDGRISSNDVTLANKAFLQANPEIAREREQIAKKAMSNIHEELKERQKQPPLMATTGEGFGTILIWTGLSIAGLLILRQLTKKRSKPNG